jgi:MFS family permease
LPKLFVLYLASAMTGTGFMTVHVALNKAIGSVTAAPHRTSAFSAVALAFSISGFCAPLFAGAAIQGAGYVASYLLLPLFAVAAGVALRKAMRVHAIPRIPRDAHESARSVDLLRYPPLRAVFIAGGLFSLAWDLFTFFAPLQGVRSGLGPTATGAIVSALAAGMFSVRLVVARLTRRHGEWNTMAGALVIATIVFFAFPLLTAFYALVIAAFLLGMGLGCGQPVSMTLLYQLAPSHRAGEAVGLRAALGSVSQTVMPIALGGLGSTVGLAAVFWSGAGLLAYGAWSASRKRLTA